VSRDRHSHHLHVHAQGSLDRMHAAWTVQCNGCDAGKAWQGCCFRKALLLPLQCITLQQY
jgi:hypothetical protein